MKKIILLTAIPTLLITSCGPSHEDQVAADNACQLVQRYEEMQAAKGTERQAMTEEFFISTMSDYVSIQVPRSNSDNVKELMKESCGDKVEIFEKIMKEK